MNKQTNTLNLDETELPALNPNGMYMIFLLGLYRLLKMQKAKNKKQKQKEKNMNVNPPQLHLVEDKINLQDM